MADEKGDEAIVSMPKNPARELRVMARIDELLSILDPEEQPRVLAWLNDRFGYHVGPSQAEITRG